MFLEGLLKRRLSSLLQPWLAEEPELDLQLGLINSSVIAKNLSFSAPALNQLMDASSPLLLKEFVIEQFAFRFSNWSAAAFTFEAVGIHVTLSFKEAEEDGSRKVSQRGSSRSVKRAISKIDPEGSILHAMVDAILTSNHSTSLSSSFLHLVLQHCFFSIREIHLQVLLPVRTVPIAYQLEIKDINAESVLSDRSLARGLVYLILQPVKEGSFDINVEGFEAGYKRSGNYISVCYLNHLSSHVKINNFKLVELNTWIPELLLLCSPVDLSIIFVLFEMFTKHHKRVRSGQQLWRLAASKLSQLVSAPRFMFYNIICLVCLWLRYVGIYEHILNQLGYYTNHSFERSIAEMPREKVFLTSVKHSWQVICSLEEQLPVEAIARARQLGRFRVLSNRQCERDNSLKFLDKAHLLEIFQVICRTFVSIAHLLGRRKYLTENSIGDGYMGIHNRSSSASFCFILSLGKFYVTIQPTKGTELRTESHYEFPAVLSFCLSIKEFLLVSTEGTVEQSLSLSCGKLKGKSFIGSFRERKARTDTCSTIFHVDPARMFVQPEAGAVDAADGVKEKCHARIERYIGDMCFQWRKACEKFEASSINFPGVPRILFESKSFLTHPFVKEKGYGLQKQCATIGKFNAVLEYSSILSLIIIIRQTSHVLDSTQVARTQVLSQTTREKSDVEQNRKYDTFVNSTKSAFLRVLPEKDIELSIHIVGPHIQLFPGKHETADGNENTRALLKDIFLLGFDLHNIEIVVWPTSKSDRAAINDSTCVDNEDPESFMFQQPQMINIPKPNDERHQFQQWISFYSCLTITGVKAYLEGIAVKLQNPILTVDSVELQLSSYREFLHGFNTSLIFSSTTSKLLVAGLSMLLFMDELCALSQVINGLCPVLSFSSCDFSSILEVHPRLFSEMVMVHEEFENGSTSMQMESLIWCCPLFLLNSSFKLMSLDTLLGSYRTGKNRSDNIKIPDPFNSKVSAAHYLSDCGIWISIRRTCLELLFEDRKLELHVMCTEIQAVTIPSQEFTGGTFDRFILRRLLLDSPSCLYELFCSHCILILSVSPSHNITFCTSTSERNSPYPEQYLHVRQETEPTFQSHGFAQKLGFVPNAQSWNSNHWVLTHVAVSEIFVTRCSVKNLLVSSQPFNKLLLSLSVAGNFQTITCEIQGGFICLEVPALAEFINCSSSFLPHINGKLSTVSSKEWQLESAKDLKDNLHTAEGIKLDMLEMFNADISHFSMILIGGDESDSVWEFMAELDLILKVSLADKRRNFVFELRRLTISSQVLHESFDQKEVATSHFSSASSCGEGSSQAACGSGSRNPVPSGEVEVQSRMSKVFSLSDPVNIVKRLAISLSAEKLENMPDILQNVWEGRGLVSGLDMTISLSELKRFLSISTTLAHVSSENQSVEPRMSDRSHNEEVDNSFEMLVPDGAIVAVQDVDQHMYFMVEGEADKYTLAGTLHYSIACERALFQVKHHFQRKWNSSVLWLCLTSLYAKDSSDRPLRLSSRPGLGFLDICSPNDFSCSLWRVLPVEPESYEGDIEGAPNIQLLKSTFHLVNKKNDCAVAFIDGVPEFVSKPGNPFKLKVLSDFFAAFNVISRSRLSANSSEMQTQATVSDNRGERPGQSGSYPCISIVVEDASLTIVDELSHTKDRLPLLRGCINHTELTLHVLASKSRVITRFIATLHYFDSQTCSWVDLLHPTEMSIFYRSRFKCQEAESVQDGVPIYIYCRAKALEIFLVELSMDMLLYFIGKLNLTGPFSVRSSMIMANCCKVYNQTSLNLSCNFSCKQSVTVGGKQSASILLRPSALSDQRPENAPFISFELSVPDSFTTTPVEFSLEEDRVLALRTRIVSVKVQDSQMHPGPIIVVDISRRFRGNLERTIVLGVLRHIDGLSIAVSPLICIRNETKFSMELRFRRPNHENEVAFVPIKIGELIEDSVASFEAINMPAGLKKALRSLSVGNILFSFRPEKSNDGLVSLERLESVDWSEEIEGGKAFRLSGIFEKLQYEVRKVFSVGSAKYSFSTISCTLKSSDGQVSYLYFLIQSIGREVPLIQPEVTRGSMDNKDPPTSFRKQKEMFLLPTVRVSNLLALNIHVSLDDNDTTTNPCSIDIGKQATIACGSTDDFYVNPEVMLISVTLVDFGLRCKALNSTEWTKKLLKHKSGLRYLDIDLDFGGAKILASLRLSRSYKGVLEAAIYTSYTLKNKTDFSLFFFPPDQKPLSRNNIQKFGSNVPPELGLLLPPQSTGSWFLKSHKVLFKLVEDNASETLFNLDTLSGQTEISLEVEQGPGVKCIAQFGISVGPSLSELNIPSQVVTFVPRHVVRNMSADIITVRQCNLQDETAGVIVVNCKKTATLLLRSEISERKEYNLFENLIKKHRKDDGSLVHIQFHVNESQLCWSGPLCITSLGRFFLKFQKPASQVRAETNKITEYAEVHVVEKGPSIEIKFYKPPQGKLPYRIENHLHAASFTYYQKDSSEQEVLGSKCSAHYVWDDLTLPRKLVVIINNANMLREIKLDKIRTWMPFYKSAQQRGLLSHVVIAKTRKETRSKFSEFEGTNVLKAGYEVYADGPMRVLRICEVSESYKGDKAAHSGAKVRLRLCRFAVHLLEQGKQDLKQKELPSHTPIVVARLEHIFLDSLFADEQKYNRVYVQSLNVDEKWAGAPFASLLRQRQLDLRGDCALKVHFVLHSAGSSVTQITYLSVLLQPLDLNLDEDTMMKVVSFWRRSLSESTESRQFYFEHFEVHPIKIFVSFVPSDSYSSYNSAQDTLRSLLHSVIKVPPIRNMVVELNGVLVTHALVTLRELIIKCSQHYSWYAMRAIYIAKGSPLLPPGFVSIFDDMSSSSLDVFFDPSRGLLNLPGVTLGTFKLLSKCINKKGFSGTKRYLGDLGKTLSTAGSNVVFAAVTEISDSVLRGAETSGFDGMVSGFHHGILKLAMEPSVLGSALIGGGPDRKIKLDRSPGADEMYIEGYLQAMLDTMFRQEYLRVRVIDDQVIIKNLPPNSSLIDEIINRVKGFLISKALLKGDPSAIPHPLDHLRGENEWRFGSTVITLCEHLFVSYAIRMLRKQASKAVGRVKWKMPLVLARDRKKEGEEQKVELEWRWGITRFLLSGVLAYVDGRLCRSIPNPLARRIVSGFLLSFLDKNDDT